MCNRSNFPSNPGSPRECPGREPKDVREPTVAGVSSPGRHHRLERGQKRKLQMKNVVKSEAAILVDIEKDLVAARREGRFEDALHHLDEIFVTHLHTQTK